MLVKHRLNLALDPAPVYLAHISIRYALAGVCYPAIIIAQPAPAQRLVNPGRSQLIERAAESSCQYLIDFAHDPIEITCCSGTVTCAGTHELWLHTLDICAGDIADRQP